MVFKSLYLNFQNIKSEVDRQPGGWGKKVKSVDEGGGIRPTWNRGRQRTYVNDKIVKRITASPTQEVRLTFCGKRREDANGLKDPPEGDWEGNGS